MDVFFIFKVILLSLFCVLVLAFCVFMLIFLYGMAIECIDDIKHGKRF